VTFDSKIIEAKLALGTIGPEKMPALAWDALEAGHDGPSIRRVAALVNPSGWEIDQLMPKFMAEAGLQVIPLQEASIRLAKHLATRILSEGLDPLKFSRDFETLCIRSDYAKAIQDVGVLDDQMFITGQTEAEFREYARNVLRELTCDDLPQSRGSS
jgi:hypothetical protein